MNPAPRASGDPPMITEFDIYFKNVDMEKINSVIKEITETLRRTGVYFSATRENIPKKLNLLHLYRVKISDYDGSSKKVLNILNKYHHLIVTVDVYIKKSI
mgnify:CR=1 FL=1